MVILPVRRSAILACRNQHAESNLEPGGPRRPSAFSPVYPKLRTLVSVAGMSQSGHNRSSKNAARHRCYPGSMPFDFDMGAAVGSVRNRTSISFLGRLLLCPQVTGTTESDIRGLSAIRLGF
jgi:hypothetical protein